MMTPTAPESTVSTDSTSTAATADLDGRRAARAQLRVKHTAHLTRLMDERTDLRGVHALADFVDDSVRWTA